MHPETLNTREQALKEDIFYTTKEERLNKGLDNPNQVATAADLACLMLGLYPKIEHPEEKNTDPEDIIYHVNEVLRQTDMGILDGKKLVTFVVCESPAELLYLEKVVKYFISRYNETPMKDLMLLNEKMHEWSHETGAEISGLEGILQLRTTKVHEAADAAIEHAASDEGADYFNRVTRPVPAYKPTAAEESEPAEGSPVPQGNIVSNPARTTDKLPRSQPVANSPVQQKYILGNPVSQTTGELPRVDTKVLVRNTKRTARDYVRTIVIPLVGIATALAGLYIVKHYVETYKTDSVTKSADAAVAAYEERPEQIVPLTEKKIVPVWKIGTTDSPNAGVEDASEPAPEQETVVKEKKPKKQYKLPYKFPKKARRYVIEKKE